jgi:hypothetical protein
MYHDDENFSIKKITGKVGDTVKPMGSNIGKAVGNAGSTVGKGVGNAGKTVGSGVVKVGKGVGKGVAKVGKGVFGFMKGLLGKLKWIAIILCVLSMSASLAPLFGWFRTIKSVLGLGQD